MEDREIKKNYFLTIFKKSMSGFTGSWNSEYYTLYEEEKKRVQSTVATQVEPYLNKDISGIVASYVPVAAYKDFRYQFSKIRLYLPRGLRGRNLGKVYVDHSSTKVILQITVGRNQQTIEFNSMGLALMYIKHKSIFHDRYQWSHKLPSCLGYSKLPEFKPTDTDLESVCTGNYTLETPEIKDNFSLVDFSKVKKREEGAIGYTNTGYFRMVIDGKLT